MTRRHWVVLFVFVVGVPGVFSWLSPGGNWDNTIFGYSFTTEADPGGFYLIGAHELVNELGRPLFLGHPGIPLLVMLSGIQHAYFAVAGSGATFADFIARNLDTVYLLSKIVMSVVSFASLAVVYALARRLGLQPVGATTAVLLYATSFPFLYFVSRISVESQAVAFGCGALLCIFAAEDTRGPSRAHRSTLLAGLSGVAAALAILSKANQTAALIGVVPVAIIWSNGSWRLKAQWFLAFAAGLAVTLVAASGVMNWSYFLGSWATPGIVPTVDAGLASSFQQIAGKLWSVFADLPTNVAKISVRPQSGFNGMFNLVESGFVVLGLAALAVKLRNRAVDRKMLIVLLFMGWTLVVWWYRGTTAFLLAFHYLFFLMVVMAISVGSAVDAIAARLAAHGLQRWTLRLVALAVFLIHGPSLWGFLDARLNDITGYRRMSQQMFALQHQLPAHSRGAMLLSDADFRYVSAYHGLDFSYVIGKTSNLEAALPLIGVMATTHTRESLATVLQSFDVVIDLIQGLDDLRSGRAAFEARDAWWAANRPLHRVINLPVPFVSCLNNCELPDGAGPEFSVRRAFDGNTSTPWYSYPAAVQQTLVVDLGFGGPRTISAVRVMNGPYDGLFANHIRLSAMRDGQPHELARLQLGPVKAGEWRELSFPTQSLDRLRLELTTSRHPSAQGYQFGIAEVQVRGSDRE